MKGWMKRMSVSLIALMMVVSGTVVSVGKDSNSVGNSSANGKGFPVSGPVLFTTPEMIQTAKLRVEHKEEPFYSAWLGVKGNADASLGRNYVPYQKEGYLKYFHTGRAQGFDARDLGLAYSITGEIKYAEKAKQILLAWAKDAQINSQPASSKPIDRGLVIARVMTIHTYAYSLVYDQLTQEDIDILEPWFRQMAELIKDCHYLWVENNYFDEQYYNNHLGGHTMGIAAIGYALNDMKLIRYALDSPLNSRNARNLIEGIIWMPNDDLWHGDPSYKGAPAPQPGEVYDRYRVVQGHGLHYTVLHLRFVALIAEMAYNNNSGVDLYKFIGKNDENLEKAFEFYADFFITGDSSVNGGYYAAENVDMYDMNVFEIAHRRYPDNVKIKQVLERRYRNVNDVQIFGRSLLLTHGMNDVESLPEEPGLGITAWEFNHDGAFSGWKMRKNMTGEVSGGLLHLTITGSDPSIISPMNLGIDASKYKSVKIGMKNNTLDTGAQLFFITNTDSNYSSSKRVGTSINSMDSSITEYEFLMSSNPNWKGTISQIRIDPVNTVDSGTVEIDYIRFTEN